MSEPTYTDIELTPEQLRELAVNIADAMTIQTRAAVLREAGLPAPYAVSKPLSVETVTLDAGGSVAGANPIVSYSWHEGFLEIATGINPSLYLTVGTHQIQLTTTDSEGCVFTGAFTVPDLRYNAYRLAGIYQCAGFPDQTISGIASFQPADGLTPATVSVIASDGDDFAVAGSAQRF